MKIRYNISIMKKLAIILLAALTLKPTTAQIGINTDTPDSTAVLHIDASDRGLLIPRHEEEDLVQDPANGLIYFNKKNRLFYYFDADSNEWNVLVPAKVNTNSRDELTIEAKVSITNDVEADNYSSNPNERGNGPIPAGGVIMWSGIVGDIPNGWALCDGANNTPDLQGRFITGYNVGNPEYDNIGDNGGSDLVTLNTNQLPEHNHTAESNGSHGHSGTVGGDGSHYHSIPTHRDRLGNYTNKGLRHIDSNTDGVSSSHASGSATHTHTVTINAGGSHAHTIQNTGGGQAHENRPRYYVLAYIMKLPK
jgi:microcystin-dependent protein